MWVLPRQEDNFNGDLPVNHIHLQGSQTQEQDKMSTGAKASVREFWIFHLDRGAECEAQ